MSGSDRRATLIIDSSERDSDLLYLSRFVATDAFTYIEVDGHKRLILSDLELDRGRSEADVDDVVSYSDLEKEAQSENKDKTPALEQVITHYLRREGIDSLRVPPRFPVRQADNLRKAGFDVQVAEDPFCPQRAVKRADEIGMIERSQEATETAMLAAIDLVRGAENRGGILHADGEPLTAERVKKFLRHTLLDLDCAATELIVACGDQGCEPHNSGSGPLRAGQSIILDVFPRSLDTHYWGDMTRTVVKGRATPELAAIHRSVLRAQEAAIAMIEPGAKGADVHRRVQAIFEEDGYVTERKDGAWHGFFHGTGHGIGLDIHENPRVSRIGSTLEEGMVLTIEPGLYYPGIGGVRIEDVVVVTAEGCRNLNRAPRDLEV